MAKRRKAKRLHDGKLSVGQAGKQLGVPAKTISDLLYQRDPDGEIAEVVGHRRRIAPAVLNEIRDALVSRGVLTLPHAQV